MANTQRNQELVAVHTKGTMPLSEIYSALPNSCFFRLLTDISYECSRKNGDNYTTYEGLWLSTVNDAHAISHYAKMRSIRPYFAGKSRVNHTIYWSGESPKTLIEAFVNAASLSKSPEYIDKEGFGFLRFKERADIEDLPVLMGLLNFYQPEDSRYNFAFFQENRRGSGSQQNHFGPRPQTRRGEKQESRDGTPGEFIPIQPRSNKVKKVKTVDDEGFMSYKKKIVSK